MHVDNTTRSITDNSTTNSYALFGTNSGTSPNITWLYSSGCSGGSPLQSGSYKVYYTDVNGCSSEPAFVCAAGTGGNALAGTAATPTITTPASAAITTATKSISGTGEAASTVSLYVDGGLVQTATVSGTGTFTFSNLTFSTGQQLYITDELNTGTVSTSKCGSQTSKYTVTCYTNPPVINADANTQTAAAQPITGISSESSGTTIKVYTSANTLIATTTVQSNGTWTTGTTTATAGTVYYATAQNGTCGVSINSGNVTAATTTSSARCGTITSPVAPGATTVSGTLSSAVASTTVNLYLDGINVGTTTTSTTSWGPITVSANTLYSNGVLSIGIQESGSGEVSCPNSVTISCSPTPAAPVISSSTNTTVGQNQSVTYTISNAVAGTYYGIADSTSGASLATGAWATTNGNLSLTTNPIPTAGTYKILVKGSSLSSVTICTALSTTAKLTVTQALPVSLVDFKGWRVNNSVTLEWSAQTEVNFSHYDIERSDDGISFSKIGEKPSMGSGSAYTFIDRYPLPSVNYYRLKIVDIDGRYEYSKIIVVQSASGLTINLARPNPFMDEVTLNVLLTTNEKLQIILLNENGQQIKKKEVEGVQGANTIKFSGLTNLSNGLYMIRVLANSSIVQQKLIKAAQ